MSYYDRLEEYNKDKKLIQAKNQEEYEKFIKELVEKWGI